MSFSEHKVLIFNSNDLNVQQSPFLCLPPELRNQIYEHVLDDWYMFLDCGKDDRRFHHAICDLDTFNEETQILKLQRRCRWRNHRKYTFDPDFYQHRSASDTFHGLLNLPLTCRQIHGEIGTIACGLTVLAQGLTWRFRLRKALMPLKHTTRFCITHVRVRFPTMCYNKRRAEKFSEELCTVLRDLKKLKHVYVHVDLDADYLDRVEHDEQRDLLGIVLEALCHVLVDVKVEVRVCWVETNQCALLELYPNLHWEDPPDVMPEML